MAKKKKRPTGSRPTASRPTASRPPGRNDPQRAATAARKEAERKAAAKAASREKLRRTLIAGGLVVAAVAVVAGVVVLRQRGAAEVREALTAGSCTVDDQTDPTAAPGSNHVSSPTYAVDPPAGGNHLAGAARAGVYTGAGVPDDGLLVHSLEHGYVILWHQPGLAGDEQQQLADVEAANDGDVIVAERASLPVPVAATAWGERLLCQATEAPVLQRFVDEQVGNGPEDVPRG